MKYQRADSMDYAHEKLAGIWAAATQPFLPGSLALDEAGFRSNLRHWVDDLKIDGFFVGGKQGEFFSMSVDERKAVFDWAVDELGPVGSILSCSDQNMDTVIDLARHAEAIGADFIVVHAPVLSFFKAQDETLYEYYKYISEQVNIGIAMWSHPDSGYLMSPELCARIAKLPNIVAIKYSVPREMYARLTQMVGKDLIVSTASEPEWLDNVIELGWRCYLCSNPPYLLQTAGDLRMREYTDLAFGGDEAGARRVWETLQPVRAAFADTRPAEKPQAHAKYWQSLLGQVGGPVRRPLLELTDAEKQQIKSAFDTTGLLQPAPVAAASHG
ncbi:MAG: dihydrodipicolinate synthase family protein [Devosiaceae bacterium]|nr:dihydrodipicolinate synthase family protein [Devosiaceae bacterium MH13]